MAVEVLLVGALAAGAALVFASRFPCAASSIVTARIVLGATLALVVAVILISTNVTELMILGALIIFLAVLNYSVVSNEETVW